MNIGEIVKKKKCVSCGMCSSVCPVSAIQMIFNPKQGFYKPKINPSVCVDCGLCNKSCPAVNSEKKASLMGEYQKIFLSHSSDMNIRKGSTSGGVINSLVRYLVEKDMVDAVLLARYDEQSPIETSGQLITKRTINELSCSPRDFASRYVVVPVLSQLKEIDDKTKKIAVVGTPCQIQALCNATQLRNKIFLKIGITCSGGMSYKATEQYKKSQKLHDAKMYYRGNGWPGYNTLIQGETQIEFKHQGSLYERMFSSQIFKNPACRNCTDHFAEQADISFCDFWNKDEMQNEKDGNSCVIIRSDSAENIFNFLVQEGYVGIVKELSEQDVLNTQMFVVKAKKGNIKKLKKYRTFMFFIDIIFKLRIYKCFNLKIYRKICSYYSRICNSVLIENQKES